jgi:hypothetical protein
MMPRKLNEQVQTCFERALDAKRKAKGTADPVLKADLLEMEKRWLALAQSYEFTAGFTGASSGWLQTFNEPRRIDKGSDEAPRLQRIIQDSRVDAIFERMWLASIVEFSQDAIHSNSLHDISQAGTRVPSGSTAISPKRPLANQWSSSFQRIACKRNASSASVSVAVSASSTLKPCAVARMKA